MKKFTKLLSIVSSILGVLTLTLGISLGVLEKPKTITSANAIDSDILVYTDNISYEYNDTFLPSESTSYLWDIGYTFNARILIYTTDTYNSYRVRIDNVYLTNFFAIFCGQSSRYSPLGSFNIPVVNFGFDYLTYYVEDYKYFELPLSVKFTCGNDVEYWVDIDFCEVFVEVGENFDDEITKSLNSTDYIKYYRATTTRYYELDAWLGYTYDFSYSENLSLINAYNDGYQSGINSGKEQVINNPADYSLYTYQEYSNYGVDKFNEGISYASENDLNFYTFLQTLFHAPVDMFKGVFNWSLPLGNGSSINLLPLMTFLLTIAIALAVIKLILGGK